MAKAGVCPLREEQDVPLRTGPSRPSQVKPPAVPDAPHASAGQAGSGAGQPQPPSHWNVPDELPAAHQNWVDLSVLEEMALRLRVCGAWDNVLADGLASLKDRVRTLEKHSRFGRHLEGSIRRPLKTWQDCRGVLVAVARSRWSTFSDIAAPVEACLTLAVLLAEWERVGVPVPTDVRVMMHGAVCVEWAAQKKFVVVDGGACLEEAPAGKQVSP